MKIVDGITRRIPEWVYNVKHTNCEMHTYNIPVESLPIHNFPEDLMLGLMMRNHNSFMANSDLDGIRIEFGAALSNY